MLKPYTVLLAFENEDGTNGFIFHCEAENADHATEQATNAYPNDMVLEVTEGESLP